MIVLRLLFFGSLAGGAIWIARRPGQLHIVWQDWQISTSLAFFLLAILIFLWCGVLCANWLKEIHIGAKKIRMHTETRAQNLATNALVRARVALENHDLKAARQQFRRLKRGKRARKWVENNPLTRLIHAEIAQKIPEESESVEKLFRTLTETRETALAGWKGLVRCAENEQKKIETLQQALKNYPDNPELVQQLYENLRQSEDEAGAHKILHQIARMEILTGDNIQEQRAQLYLKQAEKTENRPQKLDYLQKACEAKPCLGALPWMRALAETAAKHKNTKRQLEKNTEKYFSVVGAEQQAEIAKIYMHSKGETNHTKSFAALERLTGGQYSSDSMRKMAVIAALDAKIWGRARALLNEWLHSQSEQGETPIICQLMVRLERESQSENAEKKALEWMEKLAKLEI